MRFQYLVFLISAVALGIFGQEAWSRADGATKVSPPEAQASLQTGSRLFLSPDESHRAASQGLVPRGTQSILNVRKRLRYGDFVWNNNDTPGPLVVRVNLDTQLISAFRGGHEIGTAVILYGVDGHETPLGRFPIVAKLKDHHSATYDAPMPFTLRLTSDGVAVHGSKVRWGAATHGCIGVPLEFAQNLFHEASVGDVVEIIRGREKDL
ncbi:L,D-transpeptidase family protein [Erythrobacter sp. QSSC1-22B]|uniref:L,D-transpeptidase family protein n=1 Tax=Erythrobacter sp. QSSC1-22B TaxID=1860125 RepID=UPI0009F59ECA|nr:L,D-transpeptidase family protein [Erythrobacter sp. QSSC1-22B]